jgi:hypothetical protein
MADYSIFILVDKINEKIIRTVIEDRARRSANNKAGVGGGGGVDSIASSVIYTAQWYNGGTCLPCTSGTLSVAVVL